MGGSHSFSGLDDCAVLVYGSALRVFSFLVQLARGIEHALQATACGSGDLRPDIPIVPAPVYFWPAAYDRIIGVDVLATYRVRYPIQPNR